jgi:hypothetical protein
MGRVRKTPWVTRNAYGVLLGKRHRKKTLGKQRRGWRDNIKKNLSNTNNVEL